MGTELNGRNVERERDGMDGKRKGTNCKVSAVEEGNERKGDGHIYPFSAEQKKVQPSKTFISYMPLVVVVVMVAVAVAVAG